MYSSFSGHLGCFHALGTADSGAMNIGVCVSFSFMVFLEYMLSSGIARLYGHFRRRQWHSTPVLLPGKSLGQRSLIGCSPWGC